MNLHFYRTHRAKFLFSQRLSIILTQLGGLLIDRSLPDSNIGSILMILGLAIGVLLLLQSNSIREAAVNVACSILPIPGLTILIVCLVYALGVVYSGFDMQTVMSFQKVVYIIAGLLALVLMVSWQIIVSALGAKALFIRLHNGGNTKK